MVLLFAFVVPLPGVKLGKINLRLEGAEQDLFCSYGVSHVSLLFHVSDRFALISACRRVQSPLPFFLHWLQWGKAFTWRWLGGHQLGRMSIFCS